MGKIKLHLTSLIFISLIAGFIVGLLLHYCVPEGYVRDDLLVNGLLNVVGNGFIRGMRMLVVPLVFCSIVCGTMGIGDTSKMGKMGVVTIAFYTFTTIVAVAVALCVANLINPGSGMHMIPAKTVAAPTPDRQSMADTLLGIIPVNPIESFATGNMLQIIFFALLTGALLVKLGEKTEGLARLARQGNELMMSMTTLVMKAAPIGVFCLIARTFANVGFDGFAPMLKYMSAVILALTVQLMVVYLGMLRVLAGLNPLRFLRKFLPVMQFAFSTATSNATIPLSIGTLSRKMGVSEKISSFTIPLGATINMDGTSIMQGVAVVFVAQVFGIQLHLTDYITVIATATIASIGTAGVPSVGLITLSMVFESVGLPVEGIALIMGIDRLLDMCRTTVNITGDAVCTTIIAKHENLVDEGAWTRRPL